MRWSHPGFIPCTSAPSLEAAMATDPHATTRRYGYVLGGISVAAFIAVASLYFNGALQDRQDPNRNLVVAPGASQLVL